MLLTKEEKIKNEKFRRDQAYSWLNYVISRITYFDFFSKDTFEMALNSKYFAQICNRTDVTSELLLLSLFETDSELTRVLRSFKISKRKVTRLVSKTNLKYEQKNNFFERHTRNFKNFFVKYEENLNKDIIFSQEVHQIFQKSSELALKRFKTPVISASILFLTILDDETLSACKILKRCLKNPSDWPVLKYQILKSIHLQESTILEEVVKNQHYFAYLLKTQLSEKQYKTLIQKDMLPAAIEYFRNILVEEILEFDKCAYFEKETAQSMALVNNRPYLTIKEKNL